MDENNKEFKQDEHEVFIVMAQEQEFGHTKLWMNCYSTSMFGMLKSAFSQYEPLRNMARQVLKEMDAEDLDKKEPTDL